MELGQLMIRSRLTYPEVSSKVCHDSFCQLGNSVSLPWVIYYEAFYLHVVSSFSCIPVICLKLVLFLIPLQCVYLFCNLSTFILLFFSQSSPPKPCIRPYSPHTRATCPAHLILIAEQYWNRSTDHYAAHFVVFYSLI